MSNPGTPAPNPAPTPEPNPNPTPAPAPAAWYANRNDAEFTGYLQNRGLDKKDAGEAAFEAYKAHREAEKLLGAPRDELVRFPKDPVSPEWNKIYERLGRPANDTGYDFKAVKFPDGTPLDDNFSAFLQKAAFRANMSKERAEDFAKEYVTYQSKIKEAEAATAAVKLQTEQSELDKNWGPNIEAYKFIARQGAMKLGITPEAVEAMEKQVGYKAVMEGFLKAGVAFGEDRYVANRAPGTQGIMTKEQAKATLAERRADTDWAKRFMQGDTKAVQEFNALTEMMAGRAA